MTDTPNAPGPRYAVVMAGLAREQFRALIRRGRYTGTADRYLAALRQLAERLAVEPHTLGEPLYDFRAMRMHVRRAALDPLYLEYGVHFDRPFVVVRHVVGLSGPAG